MTTLARLTIGASADAWRRAGFALSDSATVHLGPVAVRLAGGDGGLVSWTFADAPFQPTDVDGLVTEHVRTALDAEGGVDVTHPNGVTSIDHVVVNTPDLERTCAAIADVTGCELRRVREVGALRQGFHRVGNVIVEVVTHPGIEPGPATLWGLALNVADIDATFASVGEAAMSVPKDAVQPGRRIASFRESAALGVPVAVMTPHRR